MSQQAQATATFIYVLRAQPRIEVPALFNILARSENRRTRHKATKKKRGKMRRARR